MNCTEPYITSGFVIGKNLLLQISSLLTAALTRDAASPRLSLLCRVTVGILLLSSTRTGYARTHTHTKCSAGQAHKQPLFQSSADNTTPTHIHTHKLVSNPPKLQITKKRRGSCHRPALRRKGEWEREGVPHTHTHMYTQTRC